MSALGPEGLNLRFVESLASASPTPGGGAASAYVGAVASALASMVGELTVGKPRYADVEDEMYASLNRLRKLRGELLGLMDDDERAFEPLARAYRMPAGTDDERKAKDQAMQAALMPATEVPIRIMAACSDVIEECAFMAERGSRLAMSDAGACAAMARGAIVAASMNVWTNVKDITREDIARDFRSRALVCLELALASADDIVSDVLDGLEAHDAAELME